MSAAPKHMVEHAIKVINEVFKLNDSNGKATLIDWRAYDDGLAINVEDTGIDSWVFANSDTVYGALPRHTWLEPINAVSLRLVRA